MDSKQSSQFTTGLVVIAIGLLMLASQFDVGWAWDFGRLWPVVFLVLGAGRFLSSDRQGLGSGAWFLFLGVVFLLHTYRVLPLSQSWPLFIVAGGISLMVPRTCAPSAPGPGAPPTAGSSSPTPPVPDGRFRP